MEFKPIDEFPGYSVSNFGRVRNDNTDRIMTLTINQHGIVQVGLVRGGMQFKRSVALLVARAFLDPPHPDTFDTPIHLDGDKFNNHIDNLMWRPRWFAIRYQRQFSSKRDIAIDRPIREVHTKQRFKNSWEAATMFGLLDREILSSIVNRTYVWPTYQQFRVIE